MTKPSPFEVLGVDADASATAIKGAWRRLAREHHPDLTGGESQKTRAATRRMAEINAAYEELRDPTRRRAAADKLRADARRAGRTPGGAGAAASSANGGTATSDVRRGGPPAPPRGRPVTGRLDTSDTFIPRNHTTTNGHRAHPIAGQPPLRRQTPREPLRASEPNGPLSRSRTRRFRPPAAPPLDESLARILEFGKFHGHTLGEIAGFEPSYIDWIASTIKRDPELVAAARVIRDDLDARGVVRVRRASHVQPASHQWEGPVT